MPAGPGERFLKNTETRIGAPGAIRWRPDRLTSDHRIGRRRRASRARQPAYSPDSAAEPDGETRTPHCNDSHRTLYTRNRLHPPTFSVSLNRGSEALSTLTRRRNEPPSRGLPAAAPRSSRHERCRFWRIWSESRHCRVIAHHHNARGSPLRRFRRHDRLLAGPLRAPTCRGLRTTLGFDGTTRERASMGGFRDPAVALSDSAMAP